MLEGLPWPVGLGVMGLGYGGFVVLAMLIVRAFVKGDLYPRHTVEELERRNAAKDKSVTELTASNERLTKSLALANTLMENLNTAVEGTKKP